MLKQNGDRRFRPDNRRVSRLALVLNVLLVVTLSCSLPRIGSTPAVTVTETPAPALGVVLPTPMPSPTPLPPALVESNPPPGAEIPLNGAITLFFNQPMDSASVEGAISGQPILSGSFSWQRDNMLTFKPDAPFLPGTDVFLTIGSNARSKGGMALQNPMTLAYRTVGYLHLTEALPIPGAAQVNPTSAVVASFNRAVYPIGSDQSSSQSELAVPAFTLEPAVEGEGRWINTSTYVFYPQPALAGGVDYTVRINPDIMGLDSSPFEPGSGEDSLPAEWNFKTSLPSLISINASDQPEGSNFDVKLDPEIVLTFNQPMNASSVAEYFTLRGPGLQSVPLSMESDPSATQFTFTPQVLLERNTRYTALLGAGALDIGGTPTGVESSSLIQTVPALRVLSTQPRQGGTKQVYDSLLLEFSAHIPGQDLTEHIVITPTVNYLNTGIADNQKSVLLFGDFAAGTSYSLTISDTLTDQWGGTLSQPYVLNFRTSPYDPELTIGFGGGDIVFLTPEDIELPGRATNMSNVPYILGEVPFEDFMVMVSPEGYDIRQTYQPLQQRSFFQTLEVPPNRSTPVTLPLSPNGSPLTPGLYYLRFTTNRAYQPSTPVLLVVSNVQVTLKASSTDAFVWATDLRDQQPVANTPVIIYDENGAPVAVGATGEDGVFQSPIPELQNPYSNLFAVIGQPGETNFGMTLSSWNQGIVEWSSDISLDYRPPRLMTYIYTDRPIYRPGQMVYFRIVARQANNGRYTMPSVAALPVTLYNDSGAEIARLDLPLSAFGTAHAEFLLPADLRPGSYQISAGNDLQDATYFNVAEYRKPEIDLQVTFDAEQSMLGETVRASISARYFFGAPASNLNLTWSLYENPEPFFLPDFETGPLDTGWLDMFQYRGSTLGQLKSYGEATTRPDGTLLLEFPTSPALSVEGVQRSLYTLEVSVVDESGFYANGRDSTVVHPGSYYIGISPSSWTPQAETQVGFDIQVADWEGASAGSRSLEAVFNKVTWVRQDTHLGSVYYNVVQIPEYSPVGRVSFNTAEDGLARLAFTPSEPGTYMLQVTGRGARFDGAASQILLWVGGPGQAAWPNLPNQRLKLSLDQESYQPGDVAQVFIPNPFNEPVIALLTLERSKVMQYQVMELAPGGSSLPLQLSDELAPNVYVSVTLLGKNEAGAPDFRVGTANLKVAPVSQVLNVELSQQPASPLSPGDRVVFSLRVTDAQGQPVKGEFSLALVDKAVLALKSPNSKEIVTAFYGLQPLAVRTAMALAAYAGRFVTSSPGMGGGGDEFVFFSLREDFPDTAYWSATLVTDANGQARVEIALPDNLTTWQLDLRGITADSRVGQARLELVTTQDLLVRPVTPRFMVAGDHLQLGAVVHNNTAASLRTEVSIQPAGFILDDSSPAIQIVDIPPAGRVRVDWWGTVSDVQKVDLIFSATSGSLRDSARPPVGSTALPSGQRLTSGSLPVLSYTARHTFATTGIMDEGGERLELVSLPQSFSVSAGALAGGELRLEMSPSLAAASLEALEALDRFPYESNENMLSRFLPNLETFRALVFFGIQDPELQARLERSLNDTILRLLSHQNADGGWSWWPSNAYDAYSDPYITAYILFGLSRAKELDFNISQVVIDRASQFLSASLLGADVIADPQLLDRLAFQYFALAQAGGVDTGGILQLYELRSQLSPWAQALLALAFDRQAGSDSPESKTLLSDLQATSIRSSSGVYWQEQARTAENLNSPVFTSAVVVYALARRDPAVTILPDAVRFLMSTRRPNGGWASSYETAWALLALTEFMKGTGEFGGSFAFNAYLNGMPVARGQAGDGSRGLSAAVAAIPLSNLYPNDPNALVIHREDGPGRLYYSAQLSVNRPVESVEPVNKGLLVNRSYYPVKADQPSTIGQSSLEESRVGETLKVRVTLVVPYDAYYVMLEDYIPAGAEIIDTSLETSALGEAEQNIYYSPAQPFEEGWGWWYFQGPHIYSDHISWAAAYLPAGTYELVYSVSLLHSGEFRVLPAHAWQYYQPDVQGSSGGVIFAIKPSNES